MYTLQLGQIRNQNTNSLHLGFGVLCFARQEGKRRGGNTWWVLVAGKGTPRRSERAADQSKMPAIARSPARRPAAFDCEAAESTKWEETRR